MVSVHSEKGLKGKVMSQVVHSENVNSDKFYRNISIDQPGFSSWHLVARPAEFLFNKNE